MSSPMLSICIPTCERQGWLQKCLEATLPQVEALPPGLVEVVVSNNASPDHTWEYLQACAADHPCLRIHQNPFNNGPENFATVVQQARGRYAWLMGDDDAPLPGAVARVLAEVQEQPRHLYLLHALETDLEDSPLERRSWFRDLPRQDWDLSRPSELEDYLDHTWYMAGAFGFISVLVFERSAWLEGHEESQAFVALGWPHVAMGLALARRHGRVRVLPDTLVLNRVGNDLGAQVDLSRRILLNLRGWVHLADHFFGGQPALRKAFLGVLHRNTSTDTILALRLHAPDLAAWEEARTLLLSAGHPPQSVAQAELAYACLQMGRRPPSRNLDPATLGFLDLGFVARGARRTALLARDPGDATTTQVLAALQAHSRTAIRVYGPQDRPPATGGVEWCPYDLDQFVAHPGGRGPVLDNLAALAPDLVINTDPGRHAGLDLLASGHSAVASIAFPAPAQGLRPEVQAWLDSPYTWILDSRAPEAMVRSLGLGPEPPTDPAAGIEPAPPTAITSHAFLVEPGPGEGPWLETVRAYLDAFQPGEPVLLILYLGRDRGEWSIESAGRKVRALAAECGLARFPEVVAVDSLAGLASLLQEHPVHSRVGLDPHDPAGLVGPFGQRFARSRRRRSVPSAG